MFVIACASCRIMTTPGRQLGVNDPNAHVTTDATADVAGHFKSPFVIGENHANIVLLHGGEDLRKMDSRYERSARVLSPLVDGAPLGAGMVLDTGLPEVRHRIVLAYDEMRMVHIIGPAQRLLIKCSQTQCIASVLDDPDDVPAFLFVPGRLRFRSVTMPCSRERPAVAAVLTFGDEGIRALRTDESRRPLGDRVYVVTEHDANGVYARLFVDAEHLWLPDRHENFIFQIRLLENWTRSRPMKGCEGTEHGGQGHER